MGTVSSGSTIVITNTCSTTLTVSSFSLNPLEFQLVDGYAPAHLNPGTGTMFILKFVPDAPQTFTGQISFTIDGVSSPVVVSLSGTGTNTNAVADVNPPTLKFGNQVLGTTSAPQTVTVTNVGTANMTVNSVSINPPFAVSGFTNPVVLKPLKSIALQVTFFGEATRTFTSTLVFSFDVLPSSGVSLSGTGIPNNKLAVTNFPLLPSATQGAPYLASLLQAGGVGPVSWGLPSGSTLPTGLTLSSGGTISGTLDSSVSVGNYPFTVQVTDANSNTVSAPLTLPVGPPTGSFCGNITMDVPGTSSPLIPLNDLGTGAYLGYEGGLYPSGSNMRPADHDAAGVSLAQSIQPLDANGNPDPNGKYVLLSVGMSNAHTDFYGFMINANADPTKNPHLVLVDGAQNGGVASHFQDPTDPFWDSIFSYFLPQAGVTANQVVAAWVEETESSFKGTFPSDLDAFHTHLVSIAQNLHSKFPNLNLAYFTSRFYCGYSNGMVHAVNPEPSGYETGFAIKNLIQDQLDGNPALNFDPSKGPVMAPWLSWGPYIWANGLLARSDGLVYSCQDLRGDGNHPSDIVGREKDGNQVLNFFKTDDTTTPWFLAPPQP